MVDGYARVASGGRWCKSVGAANLASGLQDSYLGAPRSRSPHKAVVSAPQLVSGDRARLLFSVVTKFSRLCCRPRIAAPAAPCLAFGPADPVRPTHLDFNGLQGDVIGGPDRRVDRIETDAQTRIAWSPPRRDRAGGKICSAPSGCAVAYDGAAVTEPGLR